MLNEEDNMLLGFQFVYNNPVPRSATVNMNFDTCMLLHATKDCLLIWTGLIVHTF